MQHEQKGDKRRNRAASLDAYFSLWELCCKEDEERLRPSLSSVLKSLLCSKMEDVLRSGSQLLSMEEEGELPYPPMGAAARLVITKDRVVKQSGKNFIMLQNYEHAVKIQ